MFTLRHELYGESVFTSFRTWEGKVFAFEEHFERLLVAVRSTYGLENLKISQFKEWIKTNLDIDKLIQENPNHYFRITIYSKSDISLNKVKFSLSDLSVDLNTRLTQVSNKKLRLKTFSSPFSKSFVPIKSGSYFQNLYFRKEAIKNGFDDVLFCMDNEVIEASTSNILFEKNGSYITPQGEFFLRGITLGLFEQYCLENEISYSTQKILSSELESFDKAYLLNSVQGLVSVESIDSTNFLLDESDQLRENLIKFGKGSI